METGFSRLTITFEDPFWVGLYERGGDGRLEVCKLVFGGEPKDGQVYELLLRRWQALRFSPPVYGGEAVRAISPKRRQRQAAAMLERPAGSTKSQLALQLQREQSKTERTESRKARRQAQQERNFQIRQQKKKDKHRGH